MAATGSLAWPVMLMGAILACALATILSGQVVLPLIGVRVIPIEPVFDIAEQSTVCKDLSALVPGQVHSSQDIPYHRFTDTFWSVQASEKRPNCIVQPLNAQDVSKIVTHLKQTYDQNHGTTFAVKSGGHSPEADFSTLDHGVVIDMSLINEVTVSSDQTSATIGVGARWIDAYTRLDSMGVAMVGGRDSGVGVGGLVLGGGISFFSPRFGMVCDNIDKYEIVIANGSIIEATADEHPELWRSLKGGTGNFGVVTRVTPKVFTSGDIWAGYAYWPGWSTSKVLRAFHNFNKVENFDPYAGGLIISLAYVQSIGMRMAAGSLSYTKPQAWPPVFRNIRKIWRLWSTTKVQPLLDTAHELRSLAPSGKRQFQVTTTIKNDLQTILKFNDIYTEKLKDVTKVREGIWSLVFQPLSAAVTRKGSPNVLGLETRHPNDTLIIVLISLSYEDAKDDELTHQVAREVISLGEQYARSVGTWDPYIYLNYAASGQDVYDGIGQANRDLMVATSKLYDPDGFFQYSRQGGFKLPIS